MDTMSKRPAGRPPLCKNGKPFRAQVLYTPEQVERIRLAIPRAPLSEAIRMLTLCGLGVYENRQEK